jgi:transglutaminase-like putative cysteine protease
MPNIQLRLGADFTMNSAQETAAVFVIRPEAGLEQRVLEERWQTVPDTSFHDYTDLYGNSCRRVTLPAGPFSLSYDAIVATPDDLDPYAPDAAEVPIADLPDDVLLYTLPSRYCLSDVAFFRAQDLFGGLAPGWSRIAAVCDWVNGFIRFGYGTSNVSTTSEDVLASGFGVCRDFAHLAITFCRSLNVPARYAFGYLPDIDVPLPHTEMDFCAWSEVFLGGRWWMFDPRNNVRRRGRVTIARGRDALDVAMVTTFGAVNLNNMAVRCDRVGDDVRSLV